MYRYLISCVVLMVLAGMIYSCTASRGATVETPAIQQAPSSLIEAPKKVSDNNPGSWQGWGCWDNNRREVGNPGFNPLLPMTFSISKDRIPFQSFGNPAMGDLGSIYIKGADNYLYKFINNGAGIIGYNWVNTPFPVANPATDVCWQKFTSPAVLFGGDVCHAADTRFLVIEDSAGSGTEVAWLPYLGEAQYSSPTVYPAGVGQSYIYFSSFDVNTMSSYLYCFFYDDATNTLTQIWVTPFIETALGAPMGPGLVGGSPLVWIEVKDFAGNAIVYGYDALTGALAYYTLPLGVAPALGTVTDSNGMLVTATQNAVVCLPRPTVLPPLPPQLLIPIAFIPSTGTISAPLCSSGLNRVYAMEMTGGSTFLEAFDTALFGAPWRSAPLTGTAVWAPLVDSLGDIFLTTDTDVYIIEPVLGAITFTSGSGFITGPPMLGQDNALYHTVYNSTSNTTTLWSYEN